MSFAELLGDHLPMESEAGDLSAHEDIAETQEHDFRLVEQIQAHSGPPTSGSALITQEFSRIVTSKFEDELKVERARVEALERQIADQPVRLPWRLSRSQIYRP